MLTGGACAAAIRVLNGADPQSLLTFAPIIEQAGRAYAWKPESLASTFPLVLSEPAPVAAGMDIESGRLKPAGIFGMEPVSFFSPAIQKRESPLNASIMPCDDANGLLRAVIVGAHLGGPCAGAGAVLGAKHVARHPKAISPRSTLRVSPYMAERPPKQRSRPPKPTMRQPR